MSDIGHYVYGVIAPTDAAPPREQGIDPAFGVEVLRQGALAAITSRVRLEQLSPEGADGRLAELAFRHEHVLETFLVAGLSVLPFRFGTLCASEGDVSNLLETKESTLTAALAAVDGKLEVGVRVSAEPEQMRQTILETDQELRDRDAELATLGPGAAHLRRKQLERALAERVTRELSQRSAVLHSELAGHAAAARDSSYLVPAAEVDGFIEQVRASADALGLRVDVTGPWPPYSFAEPEADDAG